MSTKKNYTLDVEHFLNVYKIRKRCYEEGVTNPLPEVKVFISELVETLSSRSPNEKVQLLKSNNGIYELRNKNGEVIIKFPDFEKLAKENNITKL